MSGLNTTASSAPPDWSAVTHDVLCPLCDYNLRGLHEPRCPECGYHFEWPEIADPTRRLHPYLYEHHPERGLRSFVSTALHGLLPRRFWRSLNPAQPSRPRRLLGYWLRCVCMMAFLGSVTMIGEQTVRMKQSVAAQASYRQSILASQRQLRQMLANPNLSSQVRQMLQQQQQYYSQTLVNARPPATSVPSLILSSLFLEMFWLFSVSFVFIWPWATYLTLSLIFRWSMQRAKVKKIHVLRCCLYSFDGYWWGGLILCAVGLMWLLNLTLPGSREALFWCPVTIILFGGLKLWRAYAEYLRFDRPLATVVASQIVVLLLILNVWFAWNPWGLARHLVPWVSI